MFSMVLVQGDFRLCQMPFLHGIEDTGLESDLEMIIDFHNHFFPPTYLAALATGAYRATVQQSRGEMRMVLQGDYNVIVEEHHNASGAYRSVGFRRCRYAGAEPDRAGRA